MRRGLRTLLGIAAAVAAAALVWQSGADRLLAPVPAAGGPFALEDTSGKPVTDKDLAGRPFALLFGYTHCPDVCPATLERAGRWLAALGADAERMRFVLATVDPARDTREALKDYLANFDPRIIGLTGSEAQVGRLLSAYRAFVSRRGEVIEHTSAVYLMDGTSRLVTLIGYDEPDEKAVAKLRALLADHAAP